MAKLAIKQIPENDEAGRILHNEMTSPLQKRYVIIDDNGTCMPEHYVKFAEAIETFEVRNSDIWVCTYPRSGTTWTQEMVWLLGNNLDYEGAKVELKQRFPYFEICTVYDFDKMDKLSGEKSPELNVDSVGFSARQENPRFIKTHLPFSLLPREIRNGSKTPKIIYVMRNSKDVCVSNFHHYKLLLSYKSTMENFCKVFLANKAMYGPFWNHIFGYWEQRNLSNVLVIRYEDMKKNIPSVIKEVASFLNKAYTEEQIEQLANHLSFDSMKNNEAVNLERVLKIRRVKNLIPQEGAFIRAGTVGKYKEELPPEIIEAFDAWIKRNIEGTSFGEQYNYEL